MRQDINTLPAPSQEGKGYSPHNLIVVSDGNFSPLERGQGVCKCLFQWLFLILQAMTIPFYTHATSPEGIRFIPTSLTVNDDSVRINLTVRAKDVRVPSGESLTLTPSLHYGEKLVSLPPIVFSGSRRARFDRREETVNPDRNRPVPYHVWICSGRRNDYTLRYLVSLPYASWMEHAELRLRQVSRDCCTERVLAEDVLTKDIGLVSPCAEVTHPLPPVERVKEYSKDSKDSVEDLVEQSVAKSVVVEVEPVVKPKEKPLENRDILPVNQANGPVAVSATLYLDYPRGSSKIDPWFGRNRRELLKVDSLLIPLLGNPHVHIKEIRITGYASPDGAYYNNEALAKSRSQGFHSYLTRLYGLEAYPVRTAWVAEDWEGLRRLIRGKPYEKAACFIIDNYGIFEGRERYLMDLSEGWPYKEMLNELFPQLRRMEIHILYDERHEK